MRFCQQLALHAQWMVCTIQLRTVWLQCCFFVLLIISCRGDVCCKKNHFFKFAFLFGYFITQYSSMRFTVRNAAQKIKFVSNDQFILLFPSTSDSSRQNPHPFRRTIRNQFIAKMRKCVISECNLINISEPLALPMTNSRSRHAIPLSFERGCCSQLGGHQHARKISS